MVYTRPRLTAKGQGGTRLVFGTTDTGRYLVIVLTPDVDGRTAFVVTARDMTRREVRVPQESEVRNVREDVERLAEHYDETDLSGEIAQAELDESVDQDPMITTSLRLPKSVLDKVREHAARAGLKPSQLMRQWIEQEAAETAEDRRRAFLLETVRIFQEASHAERVRVREDVHAELEPIRELLERLAG